MPRPTLIIGAAVVGLMLLVTAYYIQFHIGVLVPVVKSGSAAVVNKKEAFQVPPTVLPQVNTPMDNPLTRERKFEETAHPNRIENDETEEEGFQSYMNPYEYPSPSISQAYQFRLDRKSLTS
jgi:hypothetical protein